MLSSPPHPGFPARCPLCRVFGAGGGGPNDGSGTAGEGEGGNNGRATHPGKSQQGGRGGEDSSRVYLVTIIVLHSPVGHRGADSSYLTCAFEFSFAGK